MTTNERIAELVLAQTYEERIIFAEYFCHLDKNEICECLTSWAKETIKD